MATKNGKLNIKEQASVSGKKSVKDVHRELGFGDVPQDYSPNSARLDIDIALKRELKQKDLVYRFINFQEYKKRGFHRSRWVPYKRESQPENAAKYTMDPDGYTTHQSLVLAVKPVEWQNAHRKFLFDKAKQYSNPQKRQAEELKEAVYSSGVKSKVSEGFDD